MKVSYFYMLCSYFTRNCIFFGTFWKLKIFVLWQKFFENLLIFVSLFYPKNGAIDSTKTFLTKEWLVVESCPTSHWIAFLMLYRLVYNIRSHFNELILKYLPVVRHCCKLSLYAISRKTNEPNLRMTKDIDLDPNLGPQFFFHGLYLYYMLDIVASYQCMQFQGKLTKHTWENG